MRRRIPNTTALVAFETAARHQSFSRAAEEMFVTEGAVSRQIARLERFLGVGLFQRSGNRVMLSVQGARYAIEIREILARIEHESLRLLAHPDIGESLEIATIPTFGSRWLIPRLPDFHRRHPDIAVNLSERSVPFSLADSGLQAAIQFDHPAWAGMVIRRLLEEPMIAVCHPDLATVDQCSGVTLLHKRETPDAWLDFARRSGIDVGNPTAGARYDMYSLLIEAARAGLGVALVPRLYVELDLRSGNLVSPWPMAQGQEKVYVLVTRPDQTPSPGLQAFIDWLVAQGQLSIREGLLASRTEKRILD